MEPGILKRGRQALSSIRQRSTGLIGGLVRGATRRIERRITGALERRYSKNVSPARGATPAQDRIASPAADERTIRRVAESQDGGISSQASAERYERGDNPGGTHGGPGREDRIHDRLRPEDEEPQPRTSPRETRRGA
jgi:hypothetical protein